MLFQQEEIFAELVREISRTIGEDVIFTNELGIIVASTDADRIGAYHEGAKLAMEKRVYMHMTEVKTQELDGVRKGVVTPIVLDGQAIGVVGITGEPKRIEPFILVVQRLAELFIKNSADQMAQEKYMRNIELFVFDWLNQSLKTNEFHEYSDFYGIDISLYEQAILLYVPTVKSFTADEVVRIRDMWDMSKEAIVVRWGQGKLLILDEYRDKSRLNIKLIQFIETAQLLLGDHVFVGIGQEARSLQLGQSLEQAEMALQLASGERPIVFEADLVFEYIEHQLDDRMKATFMERTIAPIIEDHVLIETLNVWYSNRMKVEQTAEALHIHKNTLYYRLNKIEKLTNRKLSDMHDVVLLYMALQFHQTKK